MLREISGYGVRSRYFMGSNVTSKRDLESAKRRLGCGRKQYWATVHKANRDFEERKGAIGFPLVLLEPQRLRSDVDEDT